jgi:EAL domain-containing protein (putative c-di-GMP-specific phosphodiesterase class I)/CheY-like chemotaxis protein
VYDNQAARRQPPGIADDATSTSRLLIIDDNADLAAFVAKVARSCDYEVSVTSHAQEFCDLHQSWQPSHVLMDLEMPGTDGVELLRYLASEKSQAIVLLMSGHSLKVLESARRVAVERGLSVGPMISKPVRVAVLREMLLSVNTDQTAAVEHDLETAIRTGGLSCEFQPKVSLDSSKLVGFEALARWQHPTRGMVPPAEFITIAERSGLMSELTREVAKSAFKQLGIWRKQGLPAGLAINISATNLSDVRFADDLSDYCREFEVQPDWLTLELTETAAAANAADAMDILTRLRLKGFSLSIDDFGTGYSSLKQLQRLPFSELKVDIEFVRECVVSKDAYTIVRATVDLAHSLGLSAVAEGVENRATLDVLTRLGCDIAQGYHIGRPLPPAQVCEWATGWTKAARI